MFMISNSKPLLWRANTVCMYDMLHSNGGTMGASFCLKSSIRRYIKVEAGIFKILSNPLKILALLMIARSYRPGSASDR